jgi:hypothetical protein
MRLFSKSLLATTLLVSVSTCEFARAQHLGDVWVARSSVATGNQLKIASASGGYNPFDPLKNLAVLTPINGPYFFGWSGTSPGFDAFRTDSPTTDTYPLAPSADIWLDIVSIDPAFTVIVPPDYYFYDSPGPCTELGGYQLHIHPIWLIDSTSPSFDSTQCTWRVTFRLRDAGSTAYAPSAPFTIRFATSGVSPADFDCDGDVDLADFGHFQACFNGPNRPAAASNCGDANLDFDGDVDLADFGVFQECFNGPNRPPACQ